MRSVEPLRFRSSDRRFSLYLPARGVVALLAHVRQAGRLETGGILIGKYTEDLAEATVAEVLGPPPDSRAWGTSFLRGVHGLVRELRTLWGSAVRTYYLGEWHFHPYASSEPSPEDQRQMFSIAQDSKFRCPEAILLIIGGDPATDWEVTAHVFIRAGHVVRLERG